MVPNDKNSTIVEDFEILSTIGSGSYGTVRKVLRKKDKQIFVWKELDYSGATENQKQMLVSEVNLLKELKHEHIVRYVDRIIDKKMCILYLVMEYCEGGDLASFISETRQKESKVEEKLVWKVAYQLSTAIKECHSRSKYGKSILHRDLKPANIFLDTNFNVKLGDFGLARVLKHDSSFAKTYVGTPLYMSPEQISGGEYDEKTDLWALGCLLYELCCLRPPFLAANQMELAAKICIGKYEKIPENFSHEISSLIYSLLTLEAKHRPSINSLLSTHNFNGFNKNIVYTNKSKRKELSNSKQNSKETKQLRVNIKTPDNKKTFGNQIHRAQEKHFFSKQFDASEINRETLTQCSKEIEKLKKEMIVMRKEVNKRMSDLAEKEEELFKREADVIKRNKRIDDREKNCQVLEDSLNQKISEANKLVDEYRKLLDIEKCRLAADNKSSILIPTFSDRKKPCCKNYISNVQTSRPSIVTNTDDEMCQFQKDVHFLEEKRKRIDSQELIKLRSYMKEKMSKNKWSFDVHQNEILASTLNVETLPDF